MIGTLPLSVFLIVHVSCIAASIYYHEPSYVVFKPPTANKSDFGFAMGYQNGNGPSLIVGSPHDENDQFGLVYSCPLQRDMKKGSCEKLDININKLAGDYNRTDDKHFLLGATIASTRDYFVTCAPLWTTTHVYLGDGKKKSGSYGMCFTYDSKKKEANKINGLIEQCKKLSDKNTPYSPLYGGVGWSILADPTNELLLFGKPLGSSDIQYVQSDKLEMRTRSLYFTEYDDQYNYFSERLYKDFTNIGYALAAGKFFPDKSTYYALSMLDKISLLEKVKFLKYEKVSKTLKTTEVCRSSSLPEEWYKQMMTMPELTLSASKPGTMYGAALSSADINADGLADLLVGAPALFSVGRCEAGALYVYLGGEMTNNMESKERRRIILGEEVYSRFGAAIVTSDIDGDSLPEIIVSAPYENAGIGAIYILSGYEVKDLFARETTDGIVMLSKLRFTQRIQKKEFRSFGFSLLIIPDINDNGCDELAVGVPGNASAILLYGVPAINATVFFRTKNLVINVSNNNFDFEVCVSVTYPQNLNTISTKLQVITKIQGTGVKIENNNFDIDLAVKKPLYCENVIVKLETTPEERYFYSADLKYKDDSALEKKEFDPSWVRLSMNSVVHVNDSTSTCEHEPCFPKLSGSIIWTGGKASEEYVVEKTLKNVTVEIKNRGAMAYDACVHVKITGAKVYEISQCASNQHGYLCSIPKLDKDKTYTVKITIAIENAKSDNGLVHIVADLQERCNRGSLTPIEDKLKLKFGFKNIFLIGNSQNATVTDTQILDKKHPLFIHNHEYKIINNGSLRTDNIKIVVCVQKKKFIRNYVTTAMGKNCTKNDDEEKQVKFLCQGQRLDNNSLTINVRMEIPHASIMENLVKDKLETASHVELKMNNGTKIFIEERQTTTINYVKEKSIAHDKTAITIIMVVVATIILLLVALLLYKLGFFRRKEKTRLESFKASVKNKSGSTTVRPSIAEEADPALDVIVDDIEHFDMEVEDDCFAATPMTSADDAALIIEDKGEPMTAAAKNKNSSQDQEYANEPTSSTSQTTANDASLIEKSLRKRSIVAHDEIRNTNAHDRHSTKM